MLELVSFEDLKDLQGLGEDSVGDYPALALLKASVFVAIETELGRSLEKKERVETFQIGVYPSKYIDLVGLPVASVSEVLLDGVELDSDSFVVTKNGLRLKAKRVEVDVQVTYTGGYLQAAVPAELSRAALLQVTYEFQNKDNIGASSVTTEGGSIQKPALELLPVVVDILDGLKHPGKMT